MGTTVEQTDGDLSLATAPAVVTSQLVRVSPSEVSSPEDVARYMQMKDEEQILAACAGAIISEWVYEFKVGGKTVEGISVSGAMEVARLRAEQGFPIQFRSVDATELIQNGERGIRCIMIARDVRSGQDGIGMAFYPFLQKRKNGPPEPDDKADRKALSVAKRNAILDIVPSALVVQLLAARRELIARNQGRLTTQRDSLTGNGGQRGAAPQRAIPARAAASTEQHASQAQYDRITALASNPVITEEVRTTARTAVDRASLSAEKAQRWIAQLEQAIQAASAAKAEEGEGSFCTACGDVRVERQGQMCSGCEAEHDRVQAENQQGGELPLGDQPKAKNRDAVRAGR